MRVLIMILSFVVALCGNAQYVNCFVPGTEYFIYSVGFEPDGTHYRDPFESVLSDYTTRYGKECMEIVEPGNAWSTSKGFVYVDGTKVMFHPCVDDAEWEPAYDFGMQPGDKTQVVTMDTGVDYRHELVEVECVSIGESEWFPGQQAIKFKLRGLPLSDESDDFADEGEWLIGVGSTLGICGNTDFGMVGGNTVLGRVVLADGTEVCRSTTYRDEDFNSIEKVSAVDETRTTYYNLQGVRVENPSRGIYIKVSDGEISKEAIR